ncbi:MAG: elongation factor P [Deltaproteobacteria bacterium]|nr:elongation factor P [Deltaproteobacteria bacterium]
MYQTNQFRKNLKIEVEGIPYTIVDFQFVSPGKGGAFVRTKLKNMLNGNVIEKTFKSGDKVDKPDMENVEFQYLYREGDHFYFMNVANYEQQPLDASVIGDGKDFLKENTVIQVLFHNGKAIGIELPTFVELKVTETEPGFKGDTVSNSQKPALLETGAKITVPLFIKEGDLVKVDTRDYAYVEKLNK